MSIIKRYKTKHIETKARRAKKKAKRRFLKARNLGTMHSDGFSSLQKIWNPERTPEENTKAIYDALNSVINSAK